MKISKLVGERTKEVPAGVLSKSHEYLLRGGYIKQMCNGIFTFLPPAQRVEQKITNIIRDEMNKIEGQEVLFPVMMPRELWDESGRYSSIGNEMFRLKDRAGHDMVLGMTHEEAAVHLVKNTIRSYDQLPFMIYQFQTKLRDEPRARAGLIRVREFTMKDAYSFHMTKEDLAVYYEKCKQAYFNIYRRIGIHNKNVVCVEGDSGMMGGKISHEFMLITDIGEDSLVVCDECGYSANNEVADAVLDKYESMETELKKVNTGDNKTIEEVCKMLQIEPHNTCKAVCYYLSKSKRFVVAFVRGDLEVNEVKLRNVLQEEVVPVSASECPELVPGYIGPKQFSENVVTVYDISLKGEKNLVVGANEEPYHYSGFSFDRNINVEYHDISKVKEGQVCAHCGKGHVKLVRGVEIGNIFQLDTKYTKSMNMTVHDKDGNEVNPIMGCYGIGVGRNLACIIEDNHDDRGIIWPVNVAPWHVYIAPLRLDNEEVKLAAENLYADLNEEGFETLYDDRNVSAGVKFADSDLMGIPVRVVVSPRSLENGEVEIKIRRSGESLMCKKECVLDKIKEIIADLKKEEELY